MLKRIILFTLATLMALGLSARSTRVKNPAGKMFIYRFYLTDKNTTSYSLDKPQRFLSRKSIERRQRQQLAIDSTDLPVPRHYVRHFEVRGAQILGTSRWQNTVLVRSADTLLMQRFAQLPFVKGYRCVYIAPDSIDKPKDIRWNVRDSYNPWDSVPGDAYGTAREQIDELGGVKMHQAGFTGRGITIAIIDGGFQNYDRIHALRHARVIGVRDFVNPEYTDGSDDDEFPRQHKVGTAFHNIDHGTKVLSAMAAQEPEIVMGTAPDASYWLLRSEEHDTEQPVEEDYWTMAAEFADSIGADVINSSLGYYEYDEGRGSYRLRDLDGRTAFISRTASLLCSKGIVLCNSAGNSGMGQWKKIGVPADAHDILTVGAIDANGKLAAFSSIGPSQDGRVKPDIVARGSNTTLISGRGALVHDMGTSFSTPLVSGMVACLWQSLPEKTALEIIQLVRQSARQWDYPDNIFGYGMPDFWKAYQMGMENEE